MHIYKAIKFVADQLNLSSELFVTAESSCDSPFGFNWKSQKIVVPNFAVDDLVFMMPKSSMQLIQRIMEMNEIDNTNDNIFLFCLFHETKHYFDYNDDCNMFMFSEGIHNMYTLWLRQSNDIEEAYQFSRSFAAELYGKEFAISFSPDNKREYISSIAYRCCEAERRADNFAVGRLQIGALSI